MKPPLPCQSLDWPLEPRDLYARLLTAYGPQGWWPVVSRAAQAGFDAGGYHAGLYAEPATPAGRFEILVGAILTQNTAWRNVVLVIGALAARGLLEPVRLAVLGQDELAALIRPAGYFNQKAKKLLLATRAGLERGWWTDREPGQMALVPARAELLDIWGIGPETADSILLYGWQMPSFVVDAYTRRLLSRLAGGSGPGMVGNRGKLPFDPLRADYELLRQWFMAGLDVDAALFNEYHALIVQHGKEHCRAKPQCAGCPLIRR